MGGGGGVIIGFCEHCNEHLSSMKTRNIFATWTTINYPYRKVNDKNYETVIKNNSADRIQATGIKCQVSSDVSD
jgi:hypothetical protein